MNAGNLTERFFIGMKRKSVFPLLVLLLLSSCADAKIPSPTAVIGTFTEVIEPLETPALTEIPVTPTKTEPKEGDKRIEEGVGEQAYTVIRGKNGEIMYSGLGADENHRRRNTDTG